MSTTDCGCGCGGAPATPAAFVRPRFFAGQLLTEDDLSLLVDYVAGKDRLHNRMVSGPGVVCGLEVSCDPCGGGTLTVHPGHALDCRGNDIVLSCKEKVDVAALVRELRVSSLGVDCGDPCDDDQRHYGLFVRYEESPVEPVAPYATEEPCPSPGCSPSRVEEGFRFVVKCDTAGDHRFNPGTKLLNAIGSLERYEEVRLRGGRFGFYLDPMSIAASVTRPITFEAADAARYTTSLDWLRRNGGTAPTTPGAAADVTEHVRALASAIARYDTYDAAGQAGLSETFQLGPVDEARGTLGSVCQLLAGTDAETLWPEPVHRSVALAVVREAAARVATVDPAAPIEVRLLAQGTPVDNVLAVEFRSDLAMIREWLLGRLDRATGLADCALRDLVRAVAIPQPLPTPEPDPTRRLATTEVQELVAAAGKLTTYVERFVTDAACSTLNPPCTDCADTDVLLAHLELDGCDVVRVCSATREQVLPGGSAYGEWLPKLYRLRELAERVCCQPVPVYTPPVPPPSADTVSRTYPEGLLFPWPRTSDLDRMWQLLVTPAPGETPPKPIHEQVYTVPAEVTDSMQELNVLRSQVSDLMSTVEALRSQLDAARELVTRVQDAVPDRLGDRLASLESAPSAESPAAPEPEPEPPKPAARRGRSTSTRTPRPKPGEPS